MPPPRVLRSQPLGSRRRAWHDGDVTHVLHHRLRLLTARILCALLLVQVLIPAGLAPPRLAITGADGTLLPAVFCSAALAAREGKPVPEGADHRHCVLCRLPALAALGTGAVPAPTLPLPPAWMRIRHRVPDGPAGTVNPFQGFQARAPPPFLAA
jgi:hypothetical protein